MSKTNNTEDILEAIRDMMGEKNAKDQSELPKDVLELTKPLEENENLDDSNILELNNPINQNTGQKEFIDDDIKNIPIDEQKIRELVKEQVKLIPSERIDKIIREELERVISEKLMSAEIKFKNNDKI